LIISGNSDSITSVILQAGSILEFLRFSRRLESQADAEGMKMVLATQIDPSGMVRVFEKLEEAQHRQLESGKKDKKKAGPEKKSPGKDSEEDAPDGKRGAGEEPRRTPEWMEYLSTHPAGEDRVEVLKKMAEASTAKPRPLLPDFDWKSMHRETKDSKFIF